MDKQLMSLQGSDMVQAGNNQLQLGSVSLAYQGANCASDYFYHYYPTWYPSYHVISEKSKIEQAFKIIGKMLEKKIIEKDLTVKEFMKLVNDIAEVL